MDYDQATGQLVLFGGLEGNLDLSNDTWVWTGSTWVKENPAVSPPVREYASMSYDPATSQLLLFGGFDGSTLNDTWDWNGTTWSHLNPATSPPARQTASMAYDSPAGDVLLFGGAQSDGSLLADTWTWDGSTWTQAQPVTSPPPRQAAGMADDPPTGQVVLFGGLNPQHSFLGDTWTYGSSVPSAPTIGSATASDAQATVSFSPPSSDGGSPISSYTATATDLTNASRGGQTATASSSPITVGGLTNGDTYQLTVAATNGVGTGPGSAPSNSVVPEPGVSVTSVNPKNLAQGATATVTIKGTAFVSGATASTSNPGVTLTDVDVLKPTTLTALATVADGAPTGSFNVSVTDGSGSGTCVNCLVIHPHPVVTAANPSQLSVSATGIVTFSGSNFATSGVNVSVSGLSSALTVTNVSSTTTSVTATVSVPKGSALGAYNVTVTDPHGSEGTCDGCLTVIPTPTLRSVSPSTASQGSTTALTLQGTGFGSGGVRIAGPTGTTFTGITSVSSTEITATMTVSSSTTPGRNLQVIVKNSAASGYGQAKADLLTITASS